LEAEAFPTAATELVALQDGLRHWAADALAADPFRLPGHPLVGGCFVAFARGEAGPGRPGDRAFAAAVVWEPGHDALLRRGTGGTPVRSEGRALRGSRRLTPAPHPAGGAAPMGEPAPRLVRVPRQAADIVEQGVVEQTVASAYVPGLLALREGPVLAAAVTALRLGPDVVLVDASGADHPRRAGLALHLGWALDLPTVGVTRRPLLAAGDLPPLVRGQWRALHLGGDVVAARVCTRTGARPVVAHAAWRTDVATAVAVVLAASTEGARAPVPLQEARRVAREVRDLRRDPQPG